jgi:uncharacterized lipoprotein YddW (UPF0748 family)/N-acetylmuramoyl-L-alanine amidase
VTVAAAGAGAAGEKGAVAVGEPSRGGASDGGAQAPAAVSPAAAAAGAGAPSATGAASSAGAAGEAGAGTASGTGAAASAGAAGEAAAAPGEPERSATPSSAAPSGVGKAAAAVSVVAAEPPDLTKDEEMRGVWIATVYNIDFPATKNDPARQKQELINILDTTLAAGLDTIFFQVRPKGDALYPSELFPWSEYLTGTAGQDPGYDPLAFLLTEADRRGIQVHAWINPYRLTMGTQDKPQTDHSFLAAGSPVKQRTDLTVAAADGKLYLNPGEPEAIDLVVSGVKEIISRYPVAGIHFDDYFYPSDPNFNDSAAYERYGKPLGLSLGDWRRQNTLTLIKKVGDMIRTVKPGAAFGVSPSGIWRNQKNDPLGSDTNGYESYSQSYADTRLWVREELIDYIAPQIYWAIGTQGSDYDILARWWRSVCLGTKVKLYVGHAAYRIGNAGPWEKPTEISRQIALNRSLGAIDGSIFYGYSKIAENALGIKDRLRELFMDMDLAQPLGISYPATGYVTQAENSYIIGSADPRYPVYLNGKPVVSTVKGYFSVYAALALGENTLTFRQRDTEITHVINRDPAPATGGGGGTGGGTGPKVTYFDQPLVYVTKDAQTVVRAEASSGSTRMQPLRAGVRGHILAESNGYYLMASGNWTYKPNVTILPDEILPVARAGASRLTPGGDSLEISFPLPYFTSYYVDMSDERTVLTLHETQGQPLTRVGEDPLFGEISFSQVGEHAVYTLPHRKVGRLYGYTIQYEEKEGRLIFRFRYPVTLTQGELPLAGKTILLDPGHGGNDPGATGPAGKRGKEEKDVNLELALELAARLRDNGAKVILTREKDMPLGLEARAEMIRAQKPDLAISLHRNSMGSDKDIANYKGVLALYSHQQSAALARALGAALTRGTEHYDGGVRWQSLAVCRIEECPVALLELGFISNPADYERMNRISVIRSEAAAIVTGVLDYLAGS